MVESKKLQMALLAVIVVILLLFAKLVNTGFQHWKILDAILEYKLECIMENEPCYVEYDDRESLGRTFWRLWDWSEKRILGAGAYKAVKPYVKKAGWAGFVAQYF